MFYSPDPVQGWVIAERRGFPSLTFEDKKGARFVVSVWTSGSDIAINFDLSLPEGCNGSVLEDHFHLAFGSDAKEEKVRGFWLFDPRRESSAVSLNELVGGYTGIAERDARKRTFHRSIEWQGYVGEHHDAPQISFRVPRVMLNGVILPTCEITVRKVTKTFEEEPNQPSQPTQGKAPLG